MWTRPPESADEGLNCDRHRADRVECHALDFRAVSSGGCITNLIYKQVGELIIDRTGPSHDRQGPEVGEPAPPLSGFELGTGSAVERQPENEALVFVFPGCPGCEQIAEMLPVLAAHRQDIGITLVSVFAEQDLDRASDGVASVGEIILPDALHSAEARQGLSVIVAPTGSETSPHNRYGITATPFALVVDSDGRVAAKAMLRSPEQLPRLIGDDRESEPGTRETTGDSELITLGGRDGPIDRP